MATKPNTTPKTDENQTPPTEQNAGAGTQANSADASNATTDAKQTQTTIAAVNALEVVAFDEVFYRAKRQFTRTPTVVPLADLTDDEIAELKNEPLLSVREVAV